MSIVLDGPVGLRNRVSPVRNSLSDKVKVIGLLSAISAENGGLLTADGISVILPGPGGTCPKALVDAIWDFQGRWKSEGLIQDGVVDKGGRTIGMMNSLVGSISPIPPPPPVSNAITVRQVNPATLTSSHTIGNPVISPLSQGGLLTEFWLNVNVHEFLFEVRKGTQVFWVGACVPTGTTDFSRVQLFFHPTVINGGNVHASDADYREFKGGWSASIQRYVAMEGGQLAGARLMTMLVPFTTMAALNSRSPEKNMFTDRPVETLNAVMTAIQNELVPNSAGSPTLTSVGASSFSSGIKALRMFIGSMSGTGLLKEVIDFDSPFIIGEPKSLTAAVGATSKCYTQVGRSIPEFWWVHLPPASFARIRSFTDAHSRIGWMTYYMAMTTSSIV